MCRFGVTERQTGLDKALLEDVSRDLGEATRIRMFEVSREFVVQIAVDEASYT